MLKSLITYVKNLFSSSALLVCLYKLLAMLLTNRLRRVVSKVIFDFQTTFVREYQILDGVLITNDLVDKSKYDNKEVLFFKVDFKRTYELVCWEFLDYIWVVIVIGVLRMRLR